MRKCFLYLLAAVMLSSCDNLKKKDKTSSEEDTEETTKKKKPLEEDEESTDEEETPKKKKDKTEEEVPVDETKVNDDDKPIVVTTTLDDDGKLRGELRWTSSDRKRFMDECVGTAEKNIGEKRANEYCSCFLGKVEKKYVSYAEANRLTQTELNNWAAECNGQR